MIMILIQLYSSDVNLINIHFVNTALNANENANENDSHYAKSTVEMGGGGAESALYCTVAAQTQKRVKIETK